MTSSASSPAISIPVWDQYVDLVEWSLNSLATLFSSAGLAIIAFTIIIKTLLLPLTVKSIRSSRAMQDLQPKIKELQKKHGKDRQRMTQETMRLYSENHVNPMSGCLPMLLQIPIFFGLYTAIRHLTGSDTGYWHGGFLWLDSLNDADPLKILPILAGIFQFVQTRMMRPYKQGKITDPQQAMMNSLMNFMPLMVIVFGWTFAAGPVLYWATQSVYSVVQQWLITGWGSLREWVPWLPEMPEHRRLGYRPPRPVEDVVVMSGEDGAPPKATGAMGWLQKRMEEAQKQANTRRDAATASTGDTQARADAESAAIVEAKAQPAGGSRNGNRRGRSRSTNQRTKGKPAAKGAAARATNGASPEANGHERAAPDNGASRAVIIPRKARPTPSSDGDG